eukprot:3346194-Karenia_brevis.AAC.1
MGSKRKAAERQNRIVLAGWDWCWQAGQLVSGLANWVPGWRWVWQVGQLVSGDELAQTQVEHQPEGLEGTG